MSATTLAAWIDHAWPELSRDPLNRETTLRNLLIEFSQQNKAMIIDNKKNACAGICGHFDSHDGSTILIVAESVENLSLASVSFREGKPLDPAMCKKVVVVYLEAL